MDAETLLTFGLATVAYLLLQATLAAVLRPALLGLGARRVPVTRALVGFALAHAVCVWHFRFDWDLGYALDKGIPVFLAFHGALLILLHLGITARTPHRLRTHAIVLAWLLVASSAVVAPFKYPEIRALRIPITALTVLGAGVLLVGWRAHAAR